MYQTTTMNNTLISEHAPIKSEIKKKTARTLIIILCLLGLAAAFFTNPMTILIGLAGFCVLAATAFHITFLISILRPNPKKQI